MAKFETKLEAIKFRKKGLSLLTISRELGVSKSTVSLWCKDLEMTDRQREILKRNQIAGGSKGRIIGAEINKRKKRERIEFYRKSGIKDISKLSKRDEFLVGLSLYWAEGSKTSHLIFTNSDPVMIVFMMKWFKKYLGVRKEEFAPRVHINEIHEYRNNMIINFWSSLLSIPVGQFKRTTFVRSKQKKVYTNHNVHYGVLALRINKGIDRLYKILGLIEAIKK